ncbi:MAG: phosphate regulon sensor histidine kinase PhoR [Curvibacter sp. RIFCSPHIGHO2_12_FULL_63_18]|nr:MAG: phosphate regulon sensor histidine kinase PhoR [Curvibacter sp. GWA2_63_95]OGP04124.1 MAG: phosphate regulon sensor histidine kinase PhoR [Curvibacter sp. RIFCSPHIGHO2_12_FULL_63_18]HCX80444.1 phosphate regulon sensor histidine kinase PhoR [Rhodoferax sp.]
MVWRLLSFVGLQAAAAALAWALVAPGTRVWTALVAAIGAGYLWLLLDAVRGLRLLNWLRRGESTEVALGQGLWGEAADRMRRLLRARERQVVEGEGKLQDFLAALQASPNGVVLLDAQGRIEWFNQIAGAHFGFDVRRDLLQHFGNLVRDPEFAAYFSDRDFSRDVVMPGRDSTSAKPVRLSVQLHPYGEGRSLLLSRDITAVEQAEAMRRDFVANVSHEIRTPLTVLAGFVETLQALPLDEEERQRYLGLMAQQAQRMQSLVNDLLTLSRLEGSPLPSVHDWVSVPAVLRACETESVELSRLLWGRAQDIVFEPGPSCELAGSQPELYSAVFNLVGNAVRYTPADKSIHVRWQSLGNGACLLSVEDTGPGIAPEHVPRLTERFYRVDRSRSRDTGGTGLGLAIVKHVAQRHGAELRIDSAPGKGSVFSLVFPASRVRTMTAQTPVTV